MSSPSKYETYRDSQIPGVDLIPSHWKTLPLCAVSKIKSITNCRNKELLSVYLELGVIRFSDVNEKRTNVTSDDLSKYQEVSPGDFVLNNQQAWRGSVGVSKYEGIVSPAYIVLGLSKEIDSSFANYFFRHGAMVSQYLICSRGVGTIQRNLYWPQLKRIQIVLPPRDEQDSIANFLDQKTAEIDDAIAKKQRLIELLKEQKSILINQTVTKGLNPDVPMRDSGVEWIGKVPGHWAIKKNRELFTERKESGSESLPILTVSLHTGVSDNEQDETENIRSKIRIEDKTCYRRVYPGDIAFNMMRAWQGAIGVVKTDGQVSPAYIIASTCSLIDGEYFEYQYRTSVFIGQMDRSSKGITDFRKRLYWAEFKQLSTIVPPLDEQKKIVETIRDISKATDSVVESVVREIEQLKELRSVLIAEVVTGKIKI